MKAFIGVGLAVQIGRDKSGWFGMVVGGFGLGAGVSVNPWGRFLVGRKDFPPDANLPPGTRYGFVGDVSEISATVGFVSISKGYVVGIGTAIPPGETTPRATDIERGTGWDVSFREWGGA